MVNGMGGIVAVGDCARWIRVSLLLTSSLEGCSGSGGGGGGSGGGGAGA